MVRCNVGLGPSCPTSQSAVTHSLKRSISLRGWFLVIIACALEIALVRHVLDRRRALEVQRLENDIHDLFRSEYFSRWCHDDLVPVPSPLPTYAEVEEMARARLEARRSQVVHPDPEGLLARFRKEYDGFRIDREERFNELRMRNAFPQYDPEYLAEQLRRAQERMNALRAEAASSKPGVK